MNPLSKSAALPYSGLKVIEIADDAAGEMTGQLLAELGASCIKIEPPQGAPSRTVGPFAGQVPDPENSLNFWYYNTNKQSVVADVTQESGREVLAKLLADADILVCTWQPGRLKAAGIDYAAIAQDHPRLIVVSVTPFGLDGPWADYLSSDLIALAAGGPLASCGYDDHSIPPIRPGGNQGYHTAASFGHIGSTLALIERERTGRGQIVDVSMHEALAVSVELANPFWFYPRVLVQRQTCRHAQPIRTHSALFACADGRYVYSAFVLAEQKPWQNLVAWMDSKGLAADLTDPKFLDVSHRQCEFAHIQEVIECFFLMMDAADVYREGQERELPIGILNAPEELFADEHLKAREFFVAVDHEGRGQIFYPGPAYRFSAFKAAPIRRAPKLGEHDAPHDDSKQEQTA